MADRSLNKVMLIGRLGRDPEVRYTPNGRAVANFSLATSESWNNKDGDKEERTEWHKIVAFGKLGEICGEYLAKGRQVYLEGRIQTREWTDKEGGKRQTTEIVANEMMMLGSKSDGPASSSDRGRSGGSEPPPPEPGDGPDDDIPF